MCPMYFIYNVFSGILSKTIKKKPDAHLNSDLRKKGLKRPRKGEINYLPDLPEGETLETLMCHKEQLLNEFKKREPSKSILEEKMKLTYALRRQDIVKSPSTFSVLKKEWPVLFNPEMVSSLFYIFVHS